MFKFFYGPPTFFRGLSVVHHWLATAALKPKMIDITHNPICDHFYLDKITIIFNKNTSLQFSKHLSRFTLGAF